MKHERATHTNCDNLSCNVCNLFICSMCGGTEGSLTTDCPCYPVPYAMGEMVYAGMLDFVVDKWIETKLTDVRRIPNGLELHAS